MSQPRIVIIGSQHGNEQSPGVYLQRLVKTIKPMSGIDLVIIPVANPLAFYLNRRLVFRDMNRTWPHSSLMPWIENASLVIDMHEGWGHNACQSKSLGQTVWANGPAASYKPLLDNLVQKLNLQMDSKCRQWQRLDTLPPVGPGTLNKWCSNAGIPYILIEIAGQKNAESMDFRLKEIEIMISEIMNKEWMQKYTN